MSFVVYHNELASEDLVRSHSHKPVHLWVSGLGSSLAEAESVRPGVILVADLGALESIFARYGHSIANLFSTLPTDQIDLWRFILSRSQVGSSLIDQARADILSIEVRCDDRLGEGLAFAHAHHSLVVSASGTHPWLSAVIEVTVSEIDESGAISIVSGIELPHVGDPSHWAIHEEMVLVTPDDLRSDISVLWPTLATRFTHVRFLPSVRAQLSELDGVSRGVVLRRLAELQVALRHWDLSEERGPAWKSKVTPESDTRKKLCWFTNDAGDQFLYEMHARYTPGAGRIHFRFLSGIDQGKIEIGYVGSKLGS